MLETVGTEVVLAGKGDGLVEGGVADEADEVAVGRGDIVEHMDVGRDPSEAALAALRRG
jgi:hypothetical protein